MLKIERFEHLLEIAKKSNRSVITDSERFCADFPSASFEDCVVAFEKFAKGKSYDTVYKAYSDYQYQIGQIDAMKEMQSILTMKDCINDMLYDLKRGKEKGSSTYIEDLDNAWTWKLGEFNIWTGYTNEGKSLFLRFISIIKAIVDKWKFAFYAPEDYPAKEFFDDIIHTASGRSTDKDNIACISVNEYKRIVDILQPYFYFVYLRPPENTLINIFKKFDKLIDSEGVKVCVIDPLIKVSRPKEYMNADDKYAGYVTTLATDFARQTNTSLHLVMHQLTPKLQENGLFPKPNYYSIKGGGTWGDGTDNVLSIQRPMYGRDKQDDQILFNAQKIKKQKLVGLPQEIPYKFNRKTNRYISFTTGDDIFDFNTAFQLPQMTLRIKNKW